MNKTEITKIVEKELLEFFDAKTLLRHNKEIMEFSIEATLKAINYNRCSLQLKDLDNDNFEDWLIVNGYAIFDDYYLKNDIAFSESDLIDIYNKEVMNL